MRQRIREIRMALIILVAAIAILFYPLLSGEVLFWGTASLQFYPWRKAAFDMLRAGQLPLWNPLVGSGAPLLANYQTAALYPPNWLYLLIPTEYALGWVGLLHLIWAGLGMMAYLGRRGVGWLGQGVGAISFALNGYIVGRFSFLSMTSAIPWLPWLFWGIDGVLDSTAGQARRRSVALLAGVAGMQLLAGHAQTTFYSLILAGCYGLWRLIGLSSPRLLKPHPPVPSPPVERGRRAQQDEGENGGTSTQISLLAAGRLHMVALTGGQLLGAILLGVGLAMMQLAPTFELMQVSHRAGGVERNFAFEFSFWPWRLLELVVPGFFGSPAKGDYWGYGFYWEDSIYVGLLTLVMTGHAVLRWLEEQRAKTISRAAQLVPFLVVSLPPVTILALGRNTAIFPWLFDHVPTFDLFQAPTRWMILAVFALSALGGIGADGWHTSECRLYATRLATIGGVAILLVSVLSDRVLLPGVQPTFIRATMRLGVMVALIGLLALGLKWVEGQPDWRHWWKMAALILLAGDLVVAHWGLNPTIDPDFYYQESGFVDLLANDIADARVIYLPQDEQYALYGLYLNLGDLRPGDPAHWLDFRGSLLPNLNMIDGVSSASIFDPLRIAYYDALLRSLRPTNAPDEAGPRELTPELINTLRQMNVGVVLTPSEYANLDLIGEVGSTRAYRIPEPYRRALLADCEPMGEMLLCKPASGGSAEITESRALMVEIEVRAESDGYLLLNDTFYPGWQATNDGEPVIIQRANGAFRAVRVEEGQHVIEFWYRPMCVVVGAAVSVVSLLIGIALWFGPDTRQTHDGGLMGDG